MGRVDSPLRERMIFNVGARRSGTYWLQRIVAAHPRVSAVPSETHLISHGIAPLFERFQHEDPSSTRVGVVFAERERIVDRTRDLCDEVFGQFLEEGTLRVAERTPLHALHLDLIFEIYPDARYVHIIRDGRDVARSTLAQPWGPRTMVEAAEEWRATVTAARAARLPATRYAEVRYEELLADPPGSISALLEWLDLEADPDTLDPMLAEARRTANLDRSRPEPGSGKWREDLSAADLDAFERVAGDLLVELGYAPEASPRPSGKGTHGDPPEGAVVKRLRSLVARVSSRSGLRP